jgi:hypothetical protein
MAKDTPGEQMTETKESRPSGSHDLAHVTDAHQEALRRHLRSHWSGHPLFVVLLIAMGGAVSAAFFWLWPHLFELYSRALFLCAALALGVVLFIGRIYNDLATGGWIRLRLRVRFVFAATVVALGCMVASFSVGEWRRTRELQAFAKEVRAAREALQNLRMNELEPLKRDSATLVMDIARVSGMLAKSTKDLERLLKEGTKLETLIENSNLIAGALYADRKRVAPKTGGVLEAATTAASDVATIRSTLFGSADTATKGFFAEMRGLQGTVNRLSQMVVGDAPNDHSGLIAKVTALENAINGNPFKQDKPGLLEEVSTLRKQLAGDPKKSGEYNVRDRVETLFTLINTRLPEQQQPKMPPATEPAEDSAAALSDKRASDVESPKKSSDASDKNPGNSRTTAGAGSAGGAETSAESGGKK